MFGLCVCASTFFLFAFSFFFFFQATIVDQVFREQYFCVLFMDPQITIFNNFFIKNESYNTIYTFKNYFAIVFSVSIFNFSKNKLNPNGPIVITPCNYWGDPNGAQISKSPTSAARWMTLFEFTRCLSFHAG